MLNAEGRKRESGPSGEVESLSAKGQDSRSLMKKMGSRVSFSKPDETAEVKSKRYDLTPVSRRRVCLCALDK